MIAWSEFEQRQPFLAGAGRKQIYQFGIGLAFLATIRPGGGPRVHPVCPVISVAGLHLLIKAGPKQEDLRRDGRYALHSEACPPPRHDDGFAITGRVREVTDAQTAGMVRRQVLAERDGKVWPGFDEEAIFELSLERCLLMLTQADDHFPAGPTIWKAEGRATPASSLNLPREPGLAWGGELKSQSCRRRDPAERGRDLPAGA